MGEDSSRRIVRLINFFAAHPTESFTLSEVVDQLSISLGSAHRALRSLADARYLVRHPAHKTYSLGLALVAVGQAALERSEEHTSELQSLMRLSYAVFCLKTQIKLIR